jgi:hypothetical protein
VAVSCIGGGNWSTQRKNTDKLYQCIFPSDLKISYNNELCEEKSDVTVSKQTKRKK